MLKIMFNISVLPRFIEPVRHEEVLDLFSGPWRFAQELQARFDTWVLIKAIDSN